MQRFQWHTQLFSLPQGLPSQPRRFLQQLRRGVERGCVHLHIQSQVASPRCSAAFHFRIAHCRVCPPRTGMLFSPMWINKWLTIVSGFQYYCQMNTYSHVLITFSIYKEIWKLQKSQNFMCIHSSDPNILPWVVLFLQIQKVCCCTPSGLCSSASNL